MGAVLLNSSVKQARDGGTSGGATIAPSNKCRENGALVKRHEALEYFWFKQVLRLEGRARALEGSAAAGGGSRGSADGAGLAQARVALALKSASAGRQRDIVKTMRSEVQASHASALSFGVDLRSGELAVPWLRQG